MNTVWVLVCDAGRARFFELNGDNPTWSLVSERLHEGGGPTGGPTKDVDKSQFAHTLGATLDQAMRQARFGHWVLVAPPHFVGLVKKELTPQLEKHLMTTVDKDLAHETVEELARKLREAVSVPLDQRDAVGGRETVRHVH
jgi:protein required for attachment to host cells